MKRVSSVFAACVSSVLLACAGEQSDPNVVNIDGQGYQPGDTVGISSILSTTDFMDYVVGDRLRNIERDTSDSGFLDRFAWNTSVDNSIELFQKPLNVNLVAPFQAFKTAFDKDFVVQPDGKLLADFSFDINDPQEEQSAVALSAQIDLDIDQDNETFVAQIVIDGVVRAEITGDFGFTQVNANVFDEAGLPNANIVFTRDGQNFTVVFTQLDDQDKFTLSLTDGVIFVEADKAGDGFNQDNGEFQLTVDTNNFSGQFVGKVFFIPVSLCFGGGSLITILC
jgi:hypothetical protein